MSEAELSIAFARIGVKCGNVSHGDICGVRCVSFEAEAQLDGEGVSLLYSLSFAFLVFASEGELLRPLERGFAPFISESVGSILKYTGKTNELFTRMMINVALHSSGFTPKDGIRLLDPMSGKGTTLFEGLIMGFDVCGIELSEKLANEAHTFLKRFLETERYKHTAETERISGENKSFRAVRNSFYIAATKEDMKEGRGRSAEIISGDAAYADRYYKKNAFEIIVCDLPYGVQHGSASAESKSFTRNPKGLLQSCLGSWKRVLKTGGVVVAAFNAFLITRGEMAELFGAEGFEVLAGENYLKFGHRVDQAIKRDIIAAKK